ncbi:MAG: anhydro-N-acetylmuramic acid kinase [Bacteroidota bacterium]
MDNYKVLGMMSGTSLDGLDLAYCHFWQDNGTWDFEIRQCTTVSYNESLYNRLKNAIYLSEAEHTQLHKEYGQWLGTQAKRFIQQHKLEIDFLASHGHTSHHQPDEGITFQLGHGQEVANASGCKVICDFRSLDVRLGGQGAPLVPIGDALLLFAYDFCLNLGGISNISFRKSGKRIAFDIGLANMPLNYITDKIGLKYDSEGALAKSGKILPTLLEDLEQLNYYQLPYPKSTGYEWFSEEVQPLIEKTQSTSEDLLHTVIHHNCEQITKVIQNETQGKAGKLLVTGGGVLNTFFVSTLQEKLGANIQVVVPPKKLIEYKEAMVFAFMGVLRELGHVNVFSSVTGATEDSCSGSIFEPKL